MKLQAKVSWLLFIHHSVIWLLSHSKT